MKTMKKKGFTLVELLVVIAIIAILATVSVVGYTAFLKKANQSNAMTEAKQVEEAIEADLMANNDYTIAVVDKNTDDDADTEGMQYAENAEKTTYFVKAEDKKIYKVISKYTAAAGWTDGEETEISAKEDAGTEASPLITINDAFEVNPDFKDLKGTFAVTASGVITYTYEAGITAEIDLKN